MNETLVTLVGNAATGVEFRETASGGTARFRLAVTPRRWDREKQLWADGHTSFYTVWAWRGLASNVAASVSVGEPLLVHGRLKVREEEREGVRRTFVDVEAVAVGHDLNRGSAAFRRATRREPPFGAETGMEAGTDASAGMGTGVGEGVGGDMGTGVGTGAGGGARTRPGTGPGGPGGQDAGGPVFASEPAGDGPSWEIGPAGEEASRTRAAGAPRAAARPRKPTSRQKRPLGLTSAT
ncbi:single-stranded DNA-binding protein [Streptomyces sp. NBC_01335]|nr:single-stranded DNA-binding protein [Streptomyces sp. NBC_01335]